MSKKLFVGGLPNNISEATLKGQFYKFGNIEEVALPRDKETKRVRGFGFVTFSDEADADEAMAKMDGKTISGRTISVKEAEDRGGGGNASRRSGGHSGAYGGRRSGGRGGAGASDDQFSISGFEGRGDNIQVVAVDSSGNQLCDNRGSKLKPQSMGLSDVITGTRIGNQFVKDGKSRAKLVEFAQNIQSGIGKAPAPDSNPYNFAEWLGDNPWQAEDVEKAKHHREQDGRLSGVIDVTFIAKTPVFVPEGTPRGKSSEFFKCKKAEDGKDHFALPGSTVKGAVSSIFETLTNSRAKVMSDDLNEIPLYRRRSQFLFKVTKPPTDTVDGEAIWCPFDYCDKKHKIILQDPKNRPSQLGAKDGDNATKISGVQFWDPWRANLLLVAPPLYRHKRDKVIIAYTVSSVKVTIPRSVVKDYQSMFTPQIHPQFKASLENALRNPQCAYDKTEVEKVIQNRIPNYNRLNDDQKKEEKKKEISKYSEELARNLPGLSNDDLIFAISDKQNKIEVLSGAKKLLCFGRNVNFLWPAPKSPKETMGQFAARSESDAPFAKSDTTEATFGFVANHNGKSQHPFRGRVRFTTFWGPEMSQHESCQMKEVQLMPLTAPPGTKVKCRPLYLKVQGAGEGAKGTTWTTPGVCLRGRKIYWHQTPPNGQEIADVHCYEKMKQKGGPEITGKQAETLARIKPLKAGTEFAGQVHFSNLTKAELGALLASLDPSLLWPDDKGGEKRHGIKIGKAKPRGLGSVTSELTVKKLLPAAKRYKSLNSTSNVFEMVQPKDYIEAYQKWVAQRSSPSNSVGSDFVEKCSQVSFMKDLQVLLSIPKEVSLRIYPPKFDMYGWMPEFGKANGETSDDANKCPKPMALARNTSS